MERDTGISHGAAQYLHERLCLVSDAYRTAFCRNCGTIAEYNIVDKKYTCRRCNSENFGKMTIAYAFKLLSNYMAAMGISIRLGVSTIEEHRRKMNELERYRTTGVRALANVEEERQELEDVEMLDAEVVDDLEQEEDLEDLNDEAIYNIDLDLQEDDVDDDGNPELPRNLLGHL